MKLSIEQIKEFSNFLCREEKSTATQEKYLRDVRAFLRFAGDRPVTKELVMEWKKKLMERSYAVRSINSMLASVNSLLNFLGLADCRVKNIRLQRQTYCAEEKELTKAEYLRLLEASGKNEQLTLFGRQNVEIQATDAAGNSSEAEITDFTVSSNLFVRFVNSIWLWIVCAVLVLAILLLILFFKRKKNKNSVG